MTVAASVALLLAISAFGLYAVLRREWRAEVDRGCTSRIFGRSVRLRRDTPRSGLGLAIVRWIAELHGGTLTLTQQTNPMTKAFTIHLPVA